MMGRGLAWRCSLGRGGRGQDRSVSERSGSAGFGGLGVPCRVVARQGLARRSRYGLALQGPARRSGFGMARCGAASRGWAVWVRSGVVCRGWAVEAGFVK